MSGGGFYMFSNRDGDTPFSQSDDDIFYFEGDDDHVSSHIESTASSFDSTNERVGCQPSDDCLESPLAESEIDAFLLKVELDRNAEMVKAAAYTSSNHSPSAANNSSHSHSGTPTYSATIKMQNDPAYQMLNQPTSLDSSFTEQETIEYIIRESNWTSSLFTLPVRPAVIDLKPLYLVSYERKSGSGYRYAAYFEDTHYLGKGGYARVYLSEFTVKPCPISGFIVKDKRAEAVAVNSVSASLAVVQANALPAVGKERVVKYYFEEEAAEQPELHNALVEYNMMKVVRDEHVKRSTIWGRKINDRRYECATLVSKYHSGKSVFVWLRNMQYQGVHIPFERMPDIFIGLFKAVHEQVHQYGVVHGDLSPANMMMKDENGIYTFNVIDFGTAKKLADIKAEDIGGTTIYRSPEAISTSIKLGYKSDYFSIIRIVMHFVGLSLNYLNDKDMAADGLDKLRALNSYHINGLNQLSDMHFLMSNISIPSNIKCLLHSLILNVNAPEMNDRPDYDTIMRTLIDIKAEMNVILDLDRLDLDNIQFKEVIYDDAALDAEELAVLQLDRLKSATEISAAPTRAATPIPRSTSLASSPKSSSRFFAAPVATDVAQLTPVSVELNNPALNRAFDRLGSVVSRWFK